MLDELVKDALTEILKPILWNISYYKGVVFLSIVTFGQIRLAPPKMRSGKRPKQKKGQRRKLRFEHWFWVYRPGKKRYLHSEVTALIGLSMWLTGLALFLWTKLR